MDKNYILNINIKDYKTYFSILKNNLVDEIFIYNINNNKEIEINVINHSKKLKNIILKISNT